MSSLGSDPSREEGARTSLNECILFLKNKIGGVDHLKCMLSGAWFKTSLEPICHCRYFVYFFFSLSNETEQDFEHQAQPQRNLWCSHGWSDSTAEHKKSYIHGVVCFYLFIFKNLLVNQDLTLGLISILCISMPIIVQYTVYIYFMFTANTSYEQIIIRGWLIVTSQSVLEVIYFN